MIGKMKVTVLILLCALVLGLSVAPLAAQDKPPVAQDGPYKVGVQILNLTDSTREDRALQIFVWYPALVADDAPRPYLPDTTTAPYPLIIYSHGFGGGSTEATAVINRLVSQGYVVAAPTHVDRNDGWLPLVDRPLDITFVLNALADLPEDSTLLGAINTDNVGVMGFSFGGYTTLASGGARIDMTTFADWCAENGTLVRDTYCGSAEDRDRAQTYFDQMHPDASEDGLWAAVTDERIHAILPIAPCFGQMFGEAGLADVAVPALIVGGTTDVTCPYEFDAAYYYQHLGSPDRYLVSLDKRDHLAVIRAADVIQQYASAFFGYYLQGNTDYAQYLTPESAADFRNVTLEATLAE